MGAKRIVIGNGGGNGGLDPLSTINERGGLGVVEGDLGAVSYSSASFNAITGLNVGSVGGSVTVDAPNGTITINKAGPYKFEMDMTYVPASATELTGAFHAGGVIDERLKFKQELVSTLANKSTTTSFHDTIDIISVPVTYDYRLQPASTMNVTVEIMNMNITGVGV